MNFDNTVTIKFDKESLATMNKLIESMEKLRIEIQMNNDK
jgi:hypothetical protein